SRYLFASSISVRGLTGNITIYYAIGILLVLQWLFTYASLMQTLFTTTALSLSDWGLIVSVAATVFILVEVEKAIIRLLRKTA
ncbi:MAG: cation transporting ATPase C-terminal domain-containing protein, partial [Gammaproteobacteria bacterium]